MASHSTKLDYCFQKNHNIIVHQCNKTKSHQLCGDHLLLVGTPDNSSLVFNRFAPDNFSPFLRQCSQALWQFFNDFSRASRLTTYFLRFLRRFVPENTLHFFRRFAHENFTLFQALRAWQSAPRLRPPWPGLDPLFAPCAILSIKKPWILRRKIENSGHQE